MMPDWNIYLKQITSTIGQIATHVTFEIASSKTPVTRSVRSGTVAMIAGLLFLTPLANVAFADANSVAQTLLGQATSQIQNMIISMSGGCSGGAHGVPPVNWAQLQPHGDSAVNALTAAKLALAQGQTAKALQQINTAESELDALVDGVHGNCSGGAHGQDPVGMGGFLAIRAVVQGRLNDVRSFLGG
jgi:hypothetical protein